MNKNQTLEKQRARFGFCLWYQRALLAVLWCICRKKKQGLFWRHFKLWLSTSQAFHLDVPETNNFLICIFRKCRFHITTQQTPKGRKTTGGFLDKCQLRCSNKWQPASQSASLERSARGLVSKCLFTLHLLMHDIMKYKISFNYYA